MNRQNLFVARRFSLVAFLVLAVFWFWVSSEPVPRDKEYEVQKSEEEWKEQLGEKAFEVLRQQGTERAFTGEYWDNKKSGTYLCRACGQELFSSETKYDSGTGWPSYYKPIDDQAVDEHEDNRYGMTRIEVACSRCGGHLGHVFPDGPAPSGLRYCINSISLQFKEK